MNSACIIQCAAIDPHLFNDGGRIGGNESRVRLDSVSAAPAILLSLIIAARMRQTLTGLKITHEELVSLAMIDGLTGLLNRPGFDAVAAGAFEETRPLGQPVSALVCDIDAFRGLNDRYGHDAGDRALRNLAEASL